ncbi:MAG: DUF962 domain-containing protein [Flavobacteriales bacterium]|nr:DUF962 domain-containing protein [Flavobacteriales bacterium]MDW8431784.1 DUF962 domain-containing protein [Flavobacteriales bacterium]
MRKIDALLAEYGESHQNPTNKLIHWVCVPLIFWSVTAFLWSVQFPSVPLKSVGTSLNLAMIALGLVLLYYVRLSFSLALGMLLFGALCLGVCLGLHQFLLSHRLLPLPLVALGVFVVAWIFQFIGHKIEGKKPSFLKDLQFLLIGPAWLMHFIFKKLGIPY